MNCIHIFYSQLYTEIPVDAEDEIRSEEIFLNQVLASAINETDKADMDKPITIY